MDKNVIALYRDNKPLNIIPDAMDISQFDENT